MAVALEEVTGSRDDVGRPGGNVSGGGKASGGSEREEERAGRGRKGPGVGGEGWEREGRAGRGKKGLGGGGKGWERADRGRRGLGQVRASWSEKKAVRRKAREADGREE